MCLVLCLNDLLLFEMLEIIWFDLRYWDDIAHFVRSRLRYLRPEGLRCAHLIMPKPHIGRGNDRRSYAQRRAGWPKVSARGIMRVRAAGKSDLGGPSMETWRKPPCIYNTFGEPKKKAVLKNAGKVNGSLWGHLRYFDWSSGGTLDLEKEELFGFGNYLPY